jgi:cytochrome c-type biogenesis protein CcmH/NrfG
VPTSTRPTPPRRPSTPAPLARRSRTQIAFVILSALVVCSIVIGGAVATSFEGFFGKSDAQPTDVNYQDPNKDVIAEQQTVVAEHPDDVQAIALLGNLLGNTGQLKEANPLYEKALSMRPDDIGIRLDFARALADGNLRPDAEVQFQEIFKRDPNNQQGHYYLAELYRSWVPERKDEAIAQYRMAVEIDTTTYIAQQSRDQLDTLGVTVPSANPAAGSTPTAGSTP